MIFTANYSDGTMFTWVAFDNEQAIELAKNEAIRTGTELVNVFVSDEPMGAEKRIF